MIDYMQLPASEAERLCYAEGFENATKLFARIDALQYALGQATAEIATLKNAASDLKIKTVECEILESELSAIEKQNAAMHTAVNRACDVILMHPMAAKQILDQI